MTECKQTSFCRSLHYGTQLETSTYQHNTADYIYMYLFGMMSMNVRLLDTADACIFELMRGASMRPIPGSSADYSGR